MTWLEHDGRSMPTYATMRDTAYVRFRGGTETKYPSPVTYWMGAGNNWRWGAPADPENEIVAYKVVR